MREHSAAWRALQLLPLLAPLMAAVILIALPDRWWWFYGKETTSEHQSHMLLVVCVLLYGFRYARSRVPADLIFALGAVALFAEETDYGLLYLRHLTEVPSIDNQSFHNSSVGLALFFAVPVVFVLIPMVRPATSELRRRWFPVTRTTAAAFGVSVVFLFVSMGIEHAPQGYELREGVDEVHDLAFVFALLVTAVRPRGELQ